MPHQTIDYLKEDGMHHNVTILREASSEGFDAVLVAVPSPMLGGDQIPFSNLGLAVIANALAAQDYRVGLLDGDHQGMSPEDVKRILLGTRAHFVGFTTYQITMAHVLELAVKYKKQWPEVTICLGGYHATATAHEIINKEDVIDVVVLGRAESIIGEVVNDACQGKKPKGVLWMNDQLPPLLVTSKTRWPARDPLITTRYRAAGITGSQGCLSACTFCANAQFERLHLGPSWQSRGIKDLLDEIRDLHEHYNVEILDFYDPDSLSVRREDWKRSRKLAEAILDLPFPLRIRFTAQAFAVVKADIQDPTLWSTWRKAGLERVFVGLEANSDKVLKNFRKSSRLSDNRNALSVLAKAGIYTEVGFIMFRPDSTRDEIEANISFLEEINQADQFRTLSGRLEIYPGTEDSDRMCESGKLHMVRGCSYLALDYDFDDKIVEKTAAVAMEMRRRPEIQNLERLVLALKFGLTTGHPVIQTPLGELQRDTALKLHMFLENERTPSLTLWLRTSLKSGEPQKAGARLKLRETSLWDQVHKFYPLLRS